LARLIQDHGLGVAKQRRCHSQPLAHSQGESADPRSGHIPQADKVDHLIDARPADAVGLRQREQVIAR
jgi:hypothetical protein